VDSVKASYSQVSLVDNGGFFPESDTQQDVAWFLMDAMKVLGTDAVGLGDRDLRFGIAFLKAQIKRTGLPMISSNLLDAKTRKPVLETSVIKQIGRAKVGYFCLLSDKADLGPARDSLAIGEPSEYAQKMVKELQGKGCGVIVLLSQLGKVESEDLVASVEGINAVIVGRNGPLIQKGRLVMNTVACYGGEQGQYICRTEISLDAKGHAVGGDAEAFVLGPEVGEKKGVLELVKSFEDGFNEKLRKQEMERAAQQATKQNDESVDHFIGAELCIRCHQEEGDQWKTTSHSQAWQTLVDAKKDATPECVACHVVGYKQPGGFDSFSATPAMANVQCENCHGMGTQHDAFSSSSRMVTEQTCVTCHHGENDPEFDWDRKMPMIAHGNTSGVTIQNKKTGKNGRMMGGDKH